MTISRGRWRTAQYLRVVESEQHWSTPSHPPGTSSKTLTMECGHEVRRKGSEPTPHRVYCEECWRRPVGYDPTVYENEAWFESLSYTDEWNVRALFAVMALLGKPETFLDLGCGNGTLVKVMERLEIPWEDDREDWSVGVEVWLPDALKQFYTGRRFVQADLREPYNRGVQFDLVICWEVGEHLPEESADILSATCARHVAPGGHLVFTSAAVDQGGDHHLNEQPQSYWGNKLTASGLKYDQYKTGAVQTAWQWATGPCFWLPQNVMVFCWEDDLTPVARDSEGRALGPLAVNQRR